MGMLKAAVLALLLACAGAQAGDWLAVQAAGESVMTMRVDGDLLIDTEGRVKEYSLRTALDPKLRQMLDKAIPAWRLVPITQGGKPVNARTPMRITLAASEVAGGVEVRIDNVVFAPLTDEDRQAAWADKRAAFESGHAIEPLGEPAQAPVLISARTMHPPGYPIGLMRAGVEGVVLLNLRLNPDGTVAEVFAAQSSLLNVKGGSEILDKARALLERESKRAARRWTFTIETRDPAALDIFALTVAVPVTFVMVGPQKGQGEPFAGGWRYEFRGPNLRAPWLRAETGVQIVGVSDLTGGEQVSCNTPFRLRDRSVLNRML